MASAGGIRMGGVFVEIGADPKKFFAAYNSVQKSLGNLGKNLMTGGSRLMAAGAGALTPFAAAITQGASFESTLLDIRASTGATAGDLDRVKASAMAMSEALGIGPTEAANAIREMVKGGLTLDQVLGGAGTAAAQFAEVSQMAAGDAAVVLSKAMNAFEVDAVRASNALSAAADASATSIPEIAQAFSQVSAVAASSNQSIEDTAAALAILANKGIVGSDAGTSVKTMLMRLKAPGDEAAGALASVGLSLESLRDPDTGKLMKLPQLLGVLEKALGDVDEITKDKAMKKIFGDDAIRAAEIFKNKGEKGIEEVLQAMQDALPVSEKFKILMSGLSGAGKQVFAAFKRLAVAISEAVGPSLSSVVPAITGFINGLTNLVRANPEVVAGFAKMAVAAVAVGASMYGLGFALKVVSGGMGLVAKGFGLFTALTSPVTLVVAGVVAAGYAFYKLKDQIGAALGSVAPAVGEAAGAIGQGFNVVVADAAVVFSDLYSTATTTFNGIYDAVAAGDLSGAMDVLWAGLTAGWLRGTEAIMSYVDPWLATFNNVFTILGAEIYKTWDGLWVMVGNALNVAGAYLMGAMDNIINPILAAWDYLEAGIRKTWIRISGIFQDADAKQRELDKVDADMKGRAEKRAKDRPGIIGRMVKAGSQNAEANMALQDRQAAVDANTQQIMQGRLDALGGNAQARRDATLAAEGRLRSLVGGQAETRVQNAQADDLLAAIRGATSVDQLAGVGGLGDQFMTLKDLGRLTTEQEGAISDALDKAAEGLTRVGISDNAGAAGSGGPAVTPPDVSSKVSAAGTFSSLNLGQMFGGSSLAERTAKAAEATARGVGELVKKEGPAVAA